MEDLEQAIVYLREGFLLCPPRHPQRAILPPHHILSERSDSVVSKIREKDGFMQAVPCFKPSSFGSCPPPKILPLANLYRELSQFLAGKVADSSKGAIKVLRALWDLVVLPVKEQLVRLGVAEKTRIWSCPACLPLHAAGRYVDGQRNLPDMYFSSYTATAIYAKYS
jgi:hypothetical protein